MSKRRTPTWLIVGLLVSGAIALMTAPASASEKK